MITTDGNWTHDMRCPNPKCKAPLSIELIGVRPYGDEYHVRVMFHHRGIEMPLSFYTGEDTGGIVRSAAMIISGYLDMDTRFSVKTCAHHWESPTKVLRALAVEA